MDKQLISSIVSEFIADRQLQNRSPKTILFYKQELSYFIQFLNKQNIIYIEQITTSLIKSYLLELGTHRNRGGVACSFRAIKSFINYFDFVYGWKDNPIKKVKIPSPKIDPLPEIPIENVQLLINATYGKNQLRDSAILRTLIDNGCRAKEICDLDISSLDETGQLKILHGKGNKARITYVGSKTKKAIKDYLKTRRDNNPALFVTEDGKRFGYFGLRSIISRLSVHAGISEPPIHSFRRCFALTMYRKGVPILVISSLLGHSQLEVTRRYLAIIQMI